MEWIFFKKYIRIWEYSVLCQSCKERNLMWFFPTSILVIDYRWRLVVLLLVMVLRRSEEEEDVLGCIVIRVRPTLKHKNIMVLAWRLGMERSSILKSGDWSSQTIMPARRRRRRTIWCFEHRDNEWTECIFLGSIFLICPCDHHLNGSWHITL